MPDFTNDTYVSTPNADEFREATATLVVTDTPSDAWTAAHSIIDSFVGQEATTTVVNEYVPAMLRTDEAVIPLSRDRMIPVEAPSESAKVAEFRAANIKLLKELEQLRAISTNNAEVLEASKIVLEQTRRETSVILGEKARLHYTLDALRHTLTPDELKKFDEGVNHLLVVQSSEQDIEDLTSDNKAMQTTMGHQREEFEARYTRANAELDRLVQFAYIEGKISRTLRDDLSKVVTIVRDAGLIEADYRRFRNEVEKNKQTIARSKQIAAEHVISGRALICAAFARLPERPVVEKLTVDEKLRRANLQSMED